MLLVRFEVEHPVELRADMQRYYGLNVSDCGKAFSPFHLSACASMLPYGSSTLAAVDKSMAYSLTEMALLSMLGVDLLGNDNELPELGGLPENEFWDWYSKPRTEVKDGSKRW